MLDDISCDFTLKSFARRRRVLGVHLARRDDISAVSCQGTDGSHATSSHPLYTINIQRLAIVSQSKTAAEAPQIGKIKGFMMGNTKKSPAEAGLGKFRKTR